MTTTTKTRDGPEIAAQPRRRYADDLYGWVEDQIALLRAGRLSEIDTDNIAEVPLLGNRVDRFVWNVSTLRFESNLITLLAFQHDGSPNPPGQGDADQPARGNHDGGERRRTPPS